MARVGTLTVMQLAVYENRDGTLFYRDGGVRERVHGNQKWTALDGRPYRGKRPLEDVAIGSDGQSDDDALEQALAASLHADDDAQLRAGIEASLAVLREATGPAEAAAPPPPASPPAQVTPAQAAPPQCSICMEDIGRGQDARALPCSHTFHRA